MGLSLTMPKRITPSDEVQVEAYSALDPNWCYQFSLNAFDFYNLSHQDLLRLEMPTDFWLPLRTYFLRLNRLAERAKATSRMRISGLTSQVLPSEGAAGFRARTSPRFGVWESKDFLSFTVAERELFEEVIEYVLGKEGATQLVASALELSDHAGSDRSRRFFLIIPAHQFKSLPEHAILEIPLPEGLLLQTTVDFDAR